MDFFITMSIFTTAYCLSTTPSCETYCKTLLAGVTVTWRAECNCLSEQLTAAANKKDNNRNYKLDEDNPKIGSDFTLQAFYWHLTSQERLKTSANNVRSVPSLAEPTNLAQVVDENSKVLETAEKPETIFGIESSFVKNQFVPNNEIEINFMKSLEQDLAECVELYILMSFRSCSTTTKATDIKYKQFNECNDITDGELNQQIEYKCERVNHIIETSLSEIRMKWLSKKKKYNKNDEQQLSVGSEIGKDSTQINVDTNTTPHDSHSTIPNQYNDDQTESISSSHSNIFPEFQTETFINRSNSENSFEDEPSLKYWYSDDTKLISPVSTPYPVPYLDDNINTFLPPKYETITASDNENDETSLNVEPIYTSLDNIKIDQVELNHLNNNNTNSGEREPLELKLILKQNTTSTISENIKRSDGTNHTSPPRTNKVMSEKYISSNSNISSIEEDTSVIKIISREYPNGTVSSVINGTEIVSDNDFLDKKPSIPITKLQNNTTLNYPQKVNQYTDKIPEPKSVDYITQKQKADNKRNLKEISGYLYFEYDGKQVPVHFVQEANGNIRIGINGSRICNICPCPNEHY